MLKQFKKY